MAFLFRTTAGATLLLVFAASLHTLATYRLTQQRARLEAALAESEPYAGSGTLNATLESVRAQERALIADASSTRTPNQLMGDLTNWMDHLGINDRSIGLAPSETVAGFVLIPIEITYSCSPEQCLGLLRRLHTDTGGARIDRFRMRVIAETDPPLVTAYLRLKLSIQDTGSD